MTRILTTERQQFELWWETTMHNGSPPRFGWEHWRGGDGYRDGEFQGLWQAWQAGRKLANRETGNERQRVIDGLARAGEAWADIEEYMEKWDSYPVRYQWREIGEGGWKDCDKARYDYCQRMPELDARIVTAPPVPANAVAWEMRYWNSGYNCWHEWERITAEQHAEMSVQHATNNDYEFRVLYDAPPALAVPEEATTKNVERLAHSHLDTYQLDEDEANLAADIWNACRAAMLAQLVSQRYTLPPHVYRELVNCLRDTALKFSGTEQLRERLNTALSQFIEPDHPHTRTASPEGSSD